MRWLSKLALGAESSGTLFPRERTTKNVIAAEQGSSKKSASAYPGTEPTRKIWLLPSMRTETKFYLVFGLAGIAIVSMVRTLSESRNKVNKQPTEE